MKKQYIVCKWRLQMYSLALGHTAFISVAGSTMHASTCKGHWDNWLNGCRSRSQAHTESTTTSHISQKPHRGSQACMKKMGVKMEQNRRDESAASRRTQRPVYLRHIRWSRTEPERILEDRRKCIRQAGGDRGGCTHSCKGWVLRQEEQWQYKM